MWFPLMGNGVCEKLVRRALLAFMIRKVKLLKTRGELRKVNRPSFIYMVEMGASANAILMATIQIPRRADDCQLLLKNASS